MIDRHLTDEEDKAIRDGNRDLQMRAGARDAAWQDVVAAVDAVAVADREAGSQAYRCGVLVRLGAPRSLTDRFMEPFSRRLEDAIQSGTVGPFDGWQPTPLVSAFLPRGMPNSGARKRLEEREASLACERCGHSGVGLFRMGQSTLCVSKPACDARLSAAQAVLKPVTQV